MSSPAPVFWDVKAILDWLTYGKTLQQLQTRHGATFQWHTRQELLNAVVDLGDGSGPFRLIDAGLVGVGKGSDTNLVKALRDKNGVANNGQMPYGGNADGQYATLLQIDTIVRWIDAGCP